MNRKGLATGVDALSAGVEKIGVRTSAELLHALEQMTRPILIETTFLKHRLLVLRLSGRVPLFGFLLIRLFQPLLVRGIERGYRIDRDWEFISFQGELTLYPQQLRTT